MGKRYTPQGIEQLAQNTIKSFDGSLLTGVPTAIPIQDLIEIHLDLIVQSTSLSPEGTILGITAFEECMIPIYNGKFKHYENITVNSGTIFVESKLFHQNSSNRLRFTLAHELAHWLIHQDQFVNHDGVACKTSNQSKTIVEREADRLAAALLMPSGRVKMAYSRLKDHLAQRAAVYQLATIFSVSAQAMTIRLKELNLVQTAKKDTNTHALTCPICHTHLMDLVASSEPFANDVVGMELRLPCPRCGESVQLSLVNAN